VFTEQGVRDVKIDDIISTAGVSRRTFYRLYGGKDEVLDALYEVACDRLLFMCRLGVQDEPDPVRQIERCVDAFVTYAQQSTRLAFVLGGEAQRQESALYPRRKQTHEAVVELLMSNEKVASEGVDPMLVHALVQALEDVVQLALEEGDEGRKVSADRFERARSVMLRMATAPMVGKGPGVAPMPVLFECEELEELEPEPLRVASGGRRKR
jgi:AcrR family transcriptional regulator